MRKSKAVGASLPAAAATREEEAVGGRGGEHIPVAEGNVWVEVEVEVQAMCR
jgi:hypothetical protein